MDNGGTNPSGIWVKSARISTFIFHYPFSIVHSFKQYYTAAAERLRYNIQKEADPWTRIGRRR